MNVSIHFGGVLIKLVTFNEIFRPRTPRSSPRIIAPAKRKYWLREKSGRRPWSRGRLSLLQRAARFSAGARDVESLRTGQKKVLSFALPGISAFPAVSDDGKYLYFSHCLNDTNGDNVIDGSDNAVVFRVPLEVLIAAKSGASIFPEQLTSVETSCSFFQGPFIASFT